MADANRSAPITLRKLCVSVSFLCFTAVWSEERHEIGLSQLWPMMLQAPFGAGPGSGALRLARRQQMAARHEQIGERAGDEQAMRVLVEAAVAHPGETKNPLDDEERVLDLGRTFDLVLFFARSFSSTTLWR